MKNIYLPIKFPPRLLIFVIPLMLSAWATESTAGTISYSLSDWMWVIDYTEPTSSEPTPSTTTTSNTEPTSSEPTPSTTTTSNTEPTSSEPTPSTTTTSNTEPTSSEPTPSTTTTSNAKLTTSYSLSDWMWVIDYTEPTTSEPTSTTTTNNTNGAPIISGSPIPQIQVNNSYSFQPSSGDPDGDNLVFSITGRPFWASFDSSNGRLSGTPAVGDEGTYSNIVISVSDGSLTTALPVFSIQVDVAQTQTGTGSFTLSWTEPSSRVDNTLLFPTEIDSYTIYYGTSSGYYSNSINVDYTALTHTLTNLPIDTYYVVISTTDTDGRESTYSQEITVDVL